MSSPRADPARPGDARRGKAEHPRVSVAPLAGYETPLESGLTSVGFFDEVPAGGTVLLKPNLTYPEYRPGVMTSVECVTALTRLLRGRGYEVIIAESDGGGYNRFSMDAVFECVGIKRLAEETGARVLNMSYAEPEVIRVRSAWRTLDVRVPRVLLQGIDAFVSMPVPKIHMNTLVSLSIKNQWGCIQEPTDRLRLHPYFADVMFEVNRRLPRPYAVVDGRFGLNRSGPLRGDPVELGWLLVANDLVAADRICCRLMRVDERAVAHLQRFRQRGWWAAEDEARVEGDLSSLTRNKFYLVREWTDYPGVLCFHNRFLAWLGYHSPIAGLAHRLLYLFRKPLYDYGAERAKMGSAEGSHLRDSDPRAPGR